MEAYKVLRRKQQTYLKKWHSANIRDCDALIKVWLTRFTRGFIALTKTQTKTLNKNTL